MRVIEVLDVFPKISETFILREILAMQKKGVDIEVFAFTRSHEEIVHPEVQEVRKVTYHTNFSLLEKIYGHIYWFCKKPIQYTKTAAIAANRDNGISSLFLWNLSDVKLIHNQKPDHIHAHWPNASDFAMLVSLLTGIPFTFTTHRYEIFDKPSKNYRIKSRLAKKHITVTEYNRQYIVQNFGVDRDKIEIVHSALDFEKIYPIADSEGKNTIITIGRLKQVKGIDVLLKACAILKKEHMPFECLIVGDGPERANLEGLIRELDLMNEVTLLGFKMQDDILYLLSRAKLFVLPSRSESLGNVFTEARACRVPVIGPNTQGVPEVITDGVDGFLVEPDNIDELVSKIKILLTNEPLRKEFIEKGYNKAFQEFNIDHEAGKLLQIWEK